MTEREAYIVGFCKAAEVCGVNPEALAKLAADEAAVKEPTMWEKGKPKVKELWGKSKGSSGASKAHIGSVFNKAKAKVAPVVSNVSSNVTSAVGGLYDKSKGSSGASKANIGSAFKKEPAK